MGAAACFSFGRFKGLTTIDGGALAFDRDAWRERLVALRRLGHREEEGRMARGAAGVAEAGFHYRMNDVTAAIGLAQLERADELLGRLDRILARYRRGLAGVPFVELPEPKPYSRGLRAYCAVRVHGGRGPALRRHLAARGVETNDWLYPNHLFAAYRRYRRGRLPEAEAYCERMAHLPFYPGLTGAEVDRVVEAVRSFRA